MAILFVSDRPKPPAIAQSFGPRPARNGRTAIGSGGPPPRPRRRSGRTTSPTQPPARPNTARPSHRPEGTFARQRGDATPGRGSDVPESLVIAIRSTATFFTMLALTRVLGKRQLAQQIGRAHV